MHIEVVNLYARVSKGREKLFMNGNVNGYFNFFFSVRMAVPVPVPVN